MPYAEGRTYHDADSHIMEPPDWLQSYADPGLRDRVPPLFIDTIGGDGKPNSLEEARRLHADPAYRDNDEAELMTRKNFRATGSFLAEDRTQAIDMLGFDSQLVFNTFSSGQFARAEHTMDAEYVYGLAAAHNRGMAEFCGADRRMLSTAYVPLTDFDRAAATTRAAIDAGMHSLLVSSQCPITHSPSHIALDRVWAQAAEARIPVLLHVGGGGDLLAPAYFRNGLPEVPDFHGGAENFRSVDYMAIPYPVMQTLSVLIIDGVLERFPDLRIGVIEQGASWLPGWMRYLDSSYHAFRKNEDRLQAMSLLPSEYVRRQIRVTPYPAEDVGWIAEQAGVEVPLFSSDFPHVEGGRNPLARFGASLEGHDQTVHDHFYELNMVDLMGSALEGIAA